MPCSNTSLHFSKSNCDQQRIARPEKVKAGIRPIAFACAIAAGSIATSTSTKMAEPWAQSGAWTVISLSNGSGCQMGTKYPSGAILVISAKYALGDTPAWEILAADHGWQVIESEKTYPINIHFPGSSGAFDELLKCYADAGSRRES